MQWKRNAGGLLDTLSCCFSQYIRYIIHKVKLVCPSGLAKGPGYYARKTVHAVRTLKKLRIDAVQIPGYFSHSPTIHRQFWNIVIRLSLTYQQDVMEWSYVPAYLDNLCFLEWRVSWPAQREPKHKDMALLTSFQVNFYTLWLKYCHFDSVLNSWPKSYIWCYHSEVSWCYYSNPDAKWEQYCVHTLVKLPFFAASSRVASPTEITRKKISFCWAGGCLIIAENPKD